MPLSREQYALYFPHDLKPSRTRLIMVCGPPCGGKNTFVRERAGKRDLIIDLDDIAAKIAGSRAHGWDGRHLLPAIAERNKLLRQLASGKHPAAWYVLGAPDERRQWWYDTLQPDRVVLIDPGAETCLRRLEADPDRFQDRTARAIHQWYVTFIPRDDEELIGRTPFGNIESGSGRIPYHPAMVYQPHSNRVFYDRVRRDPNSDCWIYDGPKCGGQLHYRSFRRELAHRFAYKHFTGREIPKGMFVRHTCDNPVCVNPLHLVIGTPADNMNDKMERGRASSMPGIENPNAKLDDDKVRAIRKDTRSCKVIGAEYGVSPMIISKVRRRIFWKHVAD